MSYSQYSEHRRPPKIEGVRRVKLADTTGEDELKLEKGWDEASRKVGSGASPNTKRGAFADRLKQRR